MVMMVCVSALREFWNFIWGGEELSMGCHSVGWFFGGIDGPREEGREGGVDGCFLRSDGLAFLRDAVVCYCILDWLVGWLVGKSITMPVAQ